MRIPLPLPNVTLVFGEHLNTSHTRTVKPSHYWNSYETHLRFNYQYQLEGIKGKEDPSLKLKLDTYIGNLGGSLQ